MDITDGFIPCVADAILVSQVQTVKETSKLAYLTNTGTYIKLNDDAVKVLELCNGINTVGDITNALKQEYPEDSQIKNTVINFITQLKEVKVIHFLLEKRKEPRKLNPEVKLFSLLQHVYIEVTNACNLRCLHCYNNSGTMLEQELTTDEIKEIVDKLAKLNVLNVILTGGEPLLRRDLFEIIRYIRKKPMSVTLFTNGVLVNEEVANNLKDCNVLRVLVSLDGANAKTHDGFRGMKGAFEKTTEAIKLLAQKRLHVTVNICINKFNKNEIPQLLELVKNLGANDYTIGPLYSAGRAEGKIEELGISVTEYRKIVEIIRSYEKRIFEREKIFVRTSSLGHCGIGMRAIVIKADGTLTPCISADAEKFYLGNIRKDSLEDVWNNSDFLSQLRGIDLRNGQKCSRCQYFNICIGGCRLNAYQICRDLLSPDPFACVYYSCVAPDIVIMPQREEGRIEFEIR